VLKLLFVYLVFCSGCSLDSLSLFAGASQGRCRAAHPERKCKLCFYFYLFIIIFFFVSFAFPMTNWYYQKMTPLELAKSADICRLLLESKVLSRVLARILAYAAALIADLPSSKIDWWRRLLHLAQRRNCGPFLRLF
jgi:hypothetical protein